MKESLFMQDSWHSNHGYESMLDFQMSWLMRLAAEKDIEKPQLHKISKEVLLRLINIDKDNIQNVEIIKVEVWRQWKSIDVIAEVEIKVNGQVEQHLVVIEDKAYTMIHNNQLNRYRQSVVETYGDTRKTHYWVITFHEEGRYWERLKYDCERAEWKILSFYEVIGWKEGKFEDTESDLFNEFWLRKWY